MIRRSLALAILALSVPVLLAQSKAALPAAATQPAEPIKLYLMDGSVLAGRLSAKEIDVQTRYGLLKIPLSEIKSFTPGLDAHPELLGKITAAIEDLGADGFPEREKATQTLQKMGAEIRSELERGLKGAEGEKLSRLQKLVDELDTQKAVDDDDAPAPWVRQDIVTTNDFTLAGKITSSSFEVVSPYGALTVKLSDLRQIKRDATTPEELRKTVTVAGTLIPQRGFENSALRLAKGDVVTITASGSITMTPWGGNMSATPDGSTNFGQMQPGNIPGGALIAKLNASGQIFKVGSKFTYTADRAGVLMFSIAMPGDYTSYQFPGDYSVKIKVNKKQ